MRRGGIADDRPRREDPEGNLQHRFPEHEHRRSRAAREAGRRGGVSREGADRHRDDAEQRQPLLSHQFRQGDARAGL